MPEFFDISLISRKTSTSKSVMDACLNQLGLSEGENKSELLKGKQVVVSYFEDEESDFEEMSIGIPEQLFTKENFDNELEPITNFVNQCFQCNPNLEYALCSYELNGYLIGQVKKLQDFSANDFLKRFPVTYQRINPVDIPHLKLNTEAQEIFT
ncbi:hypothetical protein OAI64_06035 [Schleiferiaceae bacterium]|jgi:hypothetical protein|nr:hypothetical protein [Schleiferiaceae bacterium]MDA8825008.1 hypothetical protein [Schleiferiaceae bacterium]MDA8995019.1 hypothetical protein [Schleiferiaceae bacterium]MDB9928852.1 hypothetical protein [Schleiferiaceae bacterium]MDC0083756.1 hypothetical protein [Schleiferiaceae bacterium]